MRINPTPRLCPAQSIQEASSSTWMGVLGVSPTEMLKGNRRDVSVGIQVVLDDLRVEYKASSGAGLACGELPSFP